MSGFHARGLLAYCARLLVAATRNSDTLKSWLSNNLNVILSALEAAAEAADPAPRIAEPEADGDRTVHPVLPVDLTAT